jgi:colicin import membrane protein
MKVKAMKAGNSELPRASFSRHGKHLSAVLAVAMHVLLIAILFFGVRWQTHPAEPVEVDLVSTAQPEAAPVPESKLAPQPVAVPAEKIKAPLPKPDIALKEKPREKTKPPQPEAKPDPFQKLLDQELKQTSAERKTAELANAAAQELAQLQKAQTAAARSRADADYTARIVGKIRGRIPVSALPPGNPVARFAVSQLPNGEVLQVQRLQSSGFPAYDEVIERAIRASSPLPKPSMGEVPHDLTLTFCPDETRGCK